MNRKLLALLLVCATTSAAFAQQGIRFSVFANPSINWLQSDVKTVTSDGPNIGFDAGLTIDRYFAENYAFSTGISIGTLGGKLKYENAIPFSTTSADVTTRAGSTVKYNLQYITLPAGLKFKTREIGYFTYFAHLGLTTQVNIKARATTNETTNPVLDSDNISKNISILNMGYHFGGGVHYSIGGNTALVFGLTYTQGFIDITSHNDDNITSGNLAIRLGVLF